MTRRQREAIVRKQIRKMCRDMQESLFKAVPQVLGSGMLSDEYLEQIEPDNFLVAKAVIDGYMRTRPYQPLYGGHKDLFEATYMSV